MFQPNVSSAQGRFAVMPNPAVSVALVMHDRRVGLRGVRRVEDGATSGAQTVFVGFHAGRDAEKVIGISFKHRRNASDMQASLCACVPSKAPALDAASVMAPISKMRLIGMAGKKSDWCP